MTEKGVRGVRREFQPMVYKLFPISQEACNMAYSGIIKPFIKGDTMPYDLMLRYMKERNRTLFNHVRNYAEGFSQVPWNQKVGRRYFKIGAAYAYCAYSLEAKAQRGVVPIVRREVINGVLRDRTQTRGDYESDEDYALNAELDFEDYCDSALSLVRTLSILREMNMGQKKYIAIQLGAKFVHDTLETESNFRIATITAFPD